MSSFRGGIAVPLETETKTILRKEVLFSADVVELGGFISTLNFILIAKFGMTDEVKNFQKKYKDYIGLTYNEISLTDAERIYREYEGILKGNVETK